MNPVTWLNPGAAVWLLLVPLLVGLYMLRPRAERTLVPSLRLWQALPQADQPRARLRRPPLSLLLLLQALVLGAGAFALMQPSIAAPVGRTVVIMLDASGSMLTVSGGTSRFEQAREEARRLVRAMQPEDRATLLRVGSSVLTLCSSCDQKRADEALLAARPGAGRADWASALGLASGLAGRTNDGRVDSYAISDGAFDPLPFDTLPWSLHFVGVGRAEDNIAITAFSARRPPNGTPGYTAYARVDNLGGAPATLDVAALADTVPMRSHHIDLPAGGHADLAWLVPAGTAKVTVDLGASDALAADNHAVLFLPAEGQYKVALNVADPDLYIRALAGIPGLEAIDVRNADAVTGGFAFTVLEGAVPATLPPGNLLLVAPTGRFLPAQSNLTDLGPVSTEGDHPLLKGLDLRALLVDRAARYDPPGWLEPLASSSQGPLIMAGELESRRVAVLAFEPGDSNLPKLAAFPLMMANAVEWLYPLAATQALRPGDPISLSPGASVTRPDAKPSQVASSGVFVDTEEAGIYAINGDAGASARNFAVNMADLKESDAAPRAHPEMERTPQATPGKLQTVNREYWSPFAALTLVLVGAEWLFYCWKRGRS